MKLIIVRNKEELGARAGGMIAEAINAKPDIALGLATGSTPIPVYRELIRLYEKGELDFSRVRTVNLDEYIGLPANHPQSYRCFMDKNLFDHINIDKSNTYVPDGMAQNPVAECARYDAVIDRLGGVGLQLLGIGPNGHIGFNEPADAFSERTLAVRLAEATITANARFFDKPADVPERAISMGVGDIMNAKKIVLVAGPEKREIVDMAMNGAVTPNIPASVLQNHRDVTVFIIRE